jgi:hypothetical protein
MIAFGEGVNMGTILNVIVMWVLLQLLFIWFCTRLGAVRELEMKDFLELQEYIARAGLDAHAHESSPQPSPDAATHKYIPPAGVARA